MQEHFCISGKELEKEKATQQFIIILNSLFSKLMQFFQQSSEVKENERKVQKYLFWKELVPEKETRIGLRQIAIFYT